MSSQSFGSGDFLKILFAVKDNIMRDIKVASFARVKSYNSKTNEYIVEPFPQLQNENKVISCVSISNKIVEKNNLVLILFLDRNFLQNLKQYNLKTNLTYLQNLSDLHSEKYGVIISNLSSEETGTTNYNELTNKPSINGVTLQGNVSLADLNMSEYINSLIDAKLQSIDDAIETLQNQVATLNENAPYLPLNGGTINGQITITDDTNKDMSTVISNSEVKSYYIISEVCATNELAIGENDEVVITKDNISIGAYNLSYPTKSGTIALITDIPTDYVDLSSEQTISGVKTFTNGIKLGDDNYSIKKRSNGSVIDIYVNDTVNPTVVLGRSSSSFASTIRSNSTKVHSLGTADNQWKDLYLSGNLSDGTNNVSVADIAKKSEIPTKTSELENDSGFKTIDTTYTLSGSDATITLTPSSGNAQSITINNVAKAIAADSATDSDKLGGIVASSYATQTWVNTQISNLVDSAPEALDTLGELAKALQNHEDAYDALLETVGRKLDASTAASTYVPLSDVVNNLTSTSTTSVLSAYQGKVLNDKFSNYLLTSGGKVTGNIFMSLSKGIRAQQGGEYGFYAPNGVNNTYYPMISSTNRTLYINDYYQLDLDKPIYSYTFPAKDGTIALISDIPTKTSQLINDSGFITEHQDLSGYLPLSGGTLTGKLTLKSSTYNTDCALDVKNSDIWNVNGIRFADTTNAWHEGILFPSFGTSGNWDMLYTQEDGLYFALNQSEGNRNGALVPTINQLFARNNMKVIPDGSDLNDLAGSWTNQGLYTGKGSAITNSPVTGAFIMIVYNLSVSPNDTQSSSWSYRMRKIFDIRGNTYVQSCYTVGAAGQWGQYGKWNKLAFGQYGLYYVEGNTTGTEGEWTGTNNDIQSYYDGLVVNYKVGIAGGDATTLNINGFGAKPCYLRGTTAITTQYAVGTMVILSYNATTDAFYSSDYDANNYAYVRQYTTTSNTNYPMLFAYNTTLADTYNTQYARKASTIKANPSTGIITYGGGKITTTSVYANNITITAGIWAIQMRLSGGVAQSFFMYIDEANNADASLFLNRKYYNVNDGTSYLQITSATIGGNYVVTYYNSNGTPGTGRINYARIG